MKVDLYEALRERYDQMAIGAPKGAKSTVIKLLKELYTEEEAKLATQLKDTPESVDDIAKRLGRSKEEIEPLLRNMAQKGLIFFVEERGKRNYCLIILQPGQLDTCLPDFEPTERNKKLARLIEEYYTEGFSQHLYKEGTTPLSRTVVVEQQIPHQMEVLPLERASDVLKNATTIVLYTCYCRGKKWLMGERCKAPHEDMCLLLGSFGDFFLKRGYGRKISVEEALKVLQKGEELGLVHTTTNDLGDPQFLCNCCGCCCVILRGITHLKNPSSVAKSNFYLSIDQERCSGCGACLERCQVKALSIEDTVAVVDASLCIGCGICNMVCPEEALSMKRKQEITRPFDTFEEILERRMRERR